MDTALKECEKKLHQHRQSLEEQLHITNETIKCIQKARDSLVSRNHELIPITQIKQLVDNALDFQNDDNGTSRSETDLPAGDCAPTPPSSNDDATTGTPSTADNEVSLDVDIDPAATTERQSTSPNEDNITEEADTDLIIGSSIDVKVIGSLLKTNGMFYCSPLDSCKRDRELPTLSDKIKKRCAQDASLLMCNINEEEQMYAQFCRAKSMYLRCVIEKKLPDLKCQIRHVDFGTIDTVAISALNKLPSEFEYDPPHFSLKCCLFSDMPAVPYEANWCFKDLTNEKDLLLTVTDILEKDSGKVYVVDLETNDDPRILINKEVSVHAFKKVDPNDQPIQLKAELQDIVVNEEAPVKQTTNESYDEETAVLHLPVIKKSTLSWAEQCESSDSEPATQGSSSERIECSGATSVADSSDPFESKQDSRSPTPPFESKGVIIAKKPSTGSIDEWDEDESSNFQYQNQSGSSSDSNLSSKRKSKVKISKATGTCNNGDVCGGIIPALAWTDEQLQQIDDSQFYNADARYFVIVKMSLFRIEDSIATSKLMLTQDTTEKLKRVCNQSSSPIFVFVIGCSRERKMHTFRGLAQIISAVQPQLDTRRDGSFRTLNFVKVCYICTASLNKPWIERYRNGEEVALGEARRIMADVKYEIRNGRSNETVNAERKEQSLHYESTHSQKIDHAHPSSNPVAILKRGDTSWAATEIKSLSLPHIYDPSTRFIQVITNALKFCLVLKHNSYRIHYKSQAMFRKFMKTQPIDKDVVGIFYLNDRDRFPLCGVGLISPKLIDTPVPQDKNFQKDKTGHGFDKTVPSFYVKFLSTAVSYQNLLHLEDGSEITNQEGQHIIKTIIGELGKGTAKNSVDIIPIYNKDYNKDQGSKRKTSNEGKPHPSNQLNSDTTHPPQRGNAGDGRSHKNISKKHHLSNASLPQHSPTVYNNAQIPNSLPVWSSISAASEEDISHDIEGERDLACEYEVFGLDDDFNDN